MGNFQVVARFVLSEKEDAENLKRFQEDFFVVGIKTRHIELIGPGNPAVPVGDDELPERMLGGGKRP